MESFTKWFDRALGLLSVFVLIANGLDSLLAGLKPIPLAMSCALVCLYLSFRQLQKSQKANMHPKSSIMDALGRPILHDVDRANATVWVCRVLIVGASACAIVLIGMHAQSASASLHIDRVDHLQVISGNTKTIYSTAGKQDGTPVYGRGQVVVLSIVNHTSLPVDIFVVRIDILSHEERYNPALKYGKLQMSLPHTRLPIEELKTPVYFDNANSIAANYDLGVGRIRLEKAGTLEDTHQLRFRVVARTPGLWTYRVVAEYGERRAAGRRAVIHSEPLKILLRGT